MFEKLPFWPHRRLVFRTPLRPEDALRTIANDTGPITWQWGPPRAGQTPFVGEIKGHGFEIRRRIGHRNSFIPVMRGEVRAIEEGAEVTVDLGLHQAVAAFFAVWMGMGCLAFVGGLVAVLFGQLPGFIGMIFPFHGIAMLLIGFFPEVKKAEQLLSERLPPIPHEGEGPYRRS